jgi:hypothetical protein
VKPVKKVVTIPSVWAVKATRGTAELWIARGRFGLGIIPSARDKGSAALLQPVIKALLVEGFTVKLRRY